MLKNYYDEKLEVINTLLKKEKFKKVYEIINKELKMPYIPEIYEFQFIKIMNDIKSDVIGKDSLTVVPREVVIDYLLSEDPEQEMIALELLRDHNLRYEKEIIKKRIETWPVSKTTQKAYLFELLIEQEINMEVNFNGLILNSKTNGSILEKPTVIETMNQMSKYFKKNPSTLNMALDEFQRFLLISYPAVPEDGKEFAKDISQIVKSMFESKINLTKKQLRIKEMLSK